MKFEKWLSCLIAGLLAFGLGLSGVLCMRSGLSLPVSAGTLVLSCGILAVFGAFCFTTGLSFLPPGLLALTCGFFWAEGTLSLSVEALVYHCSLLCHYGYGMEPLRWSDRELSSASFLPALLLIAALTVLATAWTVCRQKNGLFALFPSLLTLASCFLVTNSVPAAHWLALWLFWVLLFLLTQGTRRISHPKGNRLTAFAALPTALGVALLFLALPQSAYQGQDRARQLLAQTQQLLEHSLTFQTQLAPQEDLRALGNLYNPHLPVMKVTAAESGTLYLRRQVFTDYTGTQWLPGGYGELPDPDPRSFWRDAGSVHIQTTGTLPYLYHPYSSFLPVNGQGAVSNTDADSYTLSQWLPKSNDHLYLWSYPLTFQAQLPSLPAQTRSWAEELARTWVADAHNFSLAAQRIAEQVRGSARYSQTVSRLPEDQTDFVRWFLEEQDRGYCVHFASATTVMLQAAGIPARYVIGYTVNVQAGHPTTVYMDDAHAWVEYYIPDVGWVLLDPTPAEGEAPPTEALPTESGTEGPSVPAPSASAAPSLPEEVPSGPEGSDPGAAAPKPGLLVWLLLLMGLIGAVIGQWQLRLWLDRRRLKQGTVNQQALACWHQLSRHARWLKQPLPAELHALAQKARFSQHRLTDRELALFLRQLQHTRQLILRQPPLRRLYLRLILGLC